MNKRGLHTREVINQCPRQEVIESRMLPDWREMHTEKGRSGRSAEISNAVRCVAMLGQTDPLRRILEPECRTE